MKVEKHLQKLSFGLIKKGILNFLLFMGISSLNAQNKSYFPSLTRVLIDKDYNVYFSYEKNATRFLNKPCYTLPKKHPVYCDSTEFGSNWVLVAKYKSPLFKDSLDIVYSAGLSADPDFTISNFKGKILHSINCTDFYINELGGIYTAGHTNNMFDQRRKFEIKKDTIIEVKQPFYYVGLKSKTLKNVILYKEKTGKDVLAQLPQNYPVEVLAAEYISGDFEPQRLFLVKTEFGLLGWLRLGDYGSSDPVIEGLFYAGD